MILIPPSPVKPAAACAANEPGVQTGRRPGVAPAQHDARQIIALHSTAIMIAQALRMYTLATTQACEIDAAV